MRHDYNFPPDWDTYSSDEKHQWYCENRALRQALRQDTTFSRMITKKLERLERRHKARSGSVDLREER